MRHAWPALLLVVACVATEPAPDLGSTSQLETADVGDDAMASDASIDAGPVVVADASDASIDAEPVVVAGTGPCTTCECAGSTDSYAADSERCASEQTLSEFRTILAALAICVAPLPRPPDFQTCYDDSLADIQLCFQACDGAQDTTAYDRKMCGWRCLVSGRETRISCCLTGRIDGRSIDLGGGSTEAARCNEDLCIRGAAEAAMACLEQGVVFVGDPIDVCEAILVTHVDRCRASTSPNPWADWGTCHMTFPSQLIGQLGAEESESRDQADSAIRATGAALFRSGSSAEQQCFLSWLRYWIPIVTDLEIRCRLHRIRTYFAR